MKKAVKIFIPFCGGILLSLVILLVIVRREEINVRKEEPEVAGVLPSYDERKAELPVNPLSGVSCVNSQRRPFAVMLAEDREARPLSGVGMADLVIEMPVVTGSITRMLAFFICEDPEEIGSVRSARHDFIPFAQGYDAIFAYWGGSHIALEELKKRKLDTLDALPNYFDTFYRKDGVPAPHDGFTSIARMAIAAGKLGYRGTANFSPYGGSPAGRQFLASPPSGDNKKRKTLAISYKYPYNVRYDYDPETNSYVRWRGDSKEIDALNGEQVEVRNVAVMRAKSRQIGGGYNDVDILGTGEASVYRNGDEIKGRWEKKEAEDPLRFFDETGEEILFTPGKIWIEVAEPNTHVTYTYT